MLQYVRKPFVKR